MSYNFKSLGEVELLGAMPEAANVFVEVDGSIRRAPQVQPVDEIAQIVNSETLAEVPEGATVIDTVTYQTVCNYSPTEVGELMLAGASCMLIMPYAAISASASTLSAAAATPTIATVQALIGVQIDDGSYQFMFFSMGDQAIITYAADGTITNSLLA